MLQLRNPIPQAVTDQKSLASFYKSLNLVPVAVGSRSTSHSFLLFLNGLYELSTSKGTCVNQIASWSFDGNVDVVRSMRPGLKVDQEETVGDELKVAYFDMLVSVGLSLRQIANVVEILSKDLDVYGNSYLRFRAVRVGEVYRVFLDRIDPKNFMYVWTDRLQPRIGVISHNFFRPTSFREDMDHEVVRVHPNMAVTENSIDTVFHWKYKRDHSDWYGRPKALHTLWDQFTEWRESDYRVKISDSDLISQLFIFLEKPDPNADTIDGKPSDIDLNALAKKLRKVTTNDSDIHSVGPLNLLKYPHGGQAPSFNTVDINRDTQWKEHVEKTCSDNIYAGHGWSKLVVGKERARGGIGGNVLLDEVVRVNESTVQPNQRNWEGRIHQVLRMINDFAPGGREEFDTLGVKFEDRLSGLAEKIRESREGKTEIDPVEPQNQVESE